MRNHPPAQSYQTPSGSIGQKINDLFNKPANQLALYALVIILTGVVLYFFYAFMLQIPIEGTSLALDWKGLWKGLYHTVPIYGNDTGLRIAPWSLWAIWPIGQLPFHASWAVLSILTLFSMIFSVPFSEDRKWLWVVSIFLLVTSYFSVRHLADGNLEGVMIAGFILLLAGFSKQKPALLALGLLLATAKVQEAWLFMLVFGVYLLRAWKSEQWMRTLFWVAVAAIPSIVWFGTDWIFGATAILERGSIMDSSLWSTASRLGVTPFWAAGFWVIVFIATLWVALRTDLSISREKAGMLIAASLILSPYTAGNSFLTVLAIGIIPLLQKNLILGAALIILIDALYFVSPDLIFNWSATYICGLLIITWLVLLARVYSSFLNFRPSIS